MKKYRKKPVVIEAIKYDGGNYMSIEKFMYGYNVRITSNNQLLIPTLEGEMKCQEGDWIIRGVKGEFYPCKPDIFDQTYEEVE
jgi:hypothetical protein